MAKKASVQTKNAKSAPVLIGAAHKLTKNGSRGNVENSRGHS